LSWRALAVALLAVGLSACSKSGRPEQSFSCQRLQARAESCARQTLARVKQGIVARARRDTLNRSQRQFKMFEYRFRKKLRSQLTRKQCEKFSAAEGSEYQRKLAEMKTCYAARDCDDFAKCTLGL
jgi:hypothetical protein